MDVRHGLCLPCVYQPRLRIADSREALQASACEPDYASGSDDDTRTQDFRGYDQAHGQPIKP